MRFLSIVKSAENQGQAPQALQDAMAKLIADSLKDGSLVQTGGLGASSTGVRVRGAGGKLAVIDGPFTEAKEVAFMRLHTEHWPSWEGECEVRPITFLAP